MNHICYYKTYLEKWCMYRPQWSYEIWLFCYNDQFETWLICHNNHFETCISLPQQPFWGMTVMPQWPFGDMTILQHHSLIPFLESQKSNMSRQLFCHTHAQMAKAGHIKYRIFRLVFLLDFFYLSDVFWCHNNGTLLQKVNGSSSFCKGPRTSKVWKSKDPSFFS